jgi:hypothetical protein
VGVLEPPATASLADRAYHAIRDMIVSLELRPGAVIDERRLMQQLGIGRTPIREGLRTLAQEGLVEVYLRHERRDPRPREPCRGPLGARKLRRPARGRACDR